MKYIQYLNREDFKGYDSLLLWYVEFCALEDCGL
jgi:hypothetical protein